MPHTLRKLIALGALAASQAAFAHSFAAGDLQIGHPFARPTVAQQPTGGAYLSIENKGKTADRLIKVSSPVAAEGQLHSMKMEGDIMRMKEVDAIDIPANGKVTMSPGNGYHIMLIKLNKPLKAGDKFPLTLTFEKAGKAEVVVNVEAPKAAASAPAPAQEPMHHKH